MEMFATVIEGIFFDNDGNFQWAGIAAIGALIIGIINYRAAKSNIISNSRIEWIQEVRKRSVDFISACHDLIMCIKNREYDKAKINELKSIIEKNATLLILYFGPDADENNEFIVYLITLLSDIIINKENYYDKKSIIKLEDEVYVLRDFLRIYFKAEWKRVNEKLSDKKVQKYIEDNDTYKRIKKIYKTGFECHKERVDNFYSGLEEKYNRN